MHAKYGWFAILGAIGAVGTALWWQGETRTQLRRELGLLREQYSVLERLRVENRRLTAAQVSVAELDNLRADHATIPQLQAEIDAMRARAREAARVAKEKLVIPPPGRFAVGSNVSASDWKNAGMMTAKATLETALWAAAGGDVDAFAKTLVLFEGQAQKEAKSLLESMPVSMREHYGTPERLIAFLTIRDVPLGAAQVRGWTELKGWPTPAEHVQLLLSSAEGKMKDVNLLFSNQSDGWKLVVTASVVERYGQMLRESSPASTVK